MCGKLFVIIRTMGLFEGCRYQSSRKSLIINEHLHTEVLMRIKEKLFIIDLNVWSTMHWPVYTMYIYGHNVCYTLTCACVHMCATHIHAHVYILRATHASFHKFTLLCAFEHVDIFALVISLCKLGPTILTIYIFLFSFLNME